MLYGYIRVSTREQNTDRQEDALVGFDIAPENLYIDHQSGKDFNRPEYKRLLGTLTTDDTLVIKSIDRLGRDYDEIIVQWRHITKEIGAHIVVIDMPLLDTRTKNSDVTGTLIADLVLQILAYVAQKEREFIVSRTKEGMAAARERGVRLGRPKMEKPDEYGAIKERWLKGEISARKAAKLLGIHHTTFMTWMKEDDSLTS